MYRNNDNFVYTFFKKNNKYFKKIIEESEKLKMMTTTNTTENLNTNNDVQTKQMNIPTPEQINMNEFRNLQKQMKKNERLDDINKRNEKLSKIITKIDKIKTNATNTANKQFSELEKTKNYIEKLQKQYELREIKIKTKLSNMYIRNDKTIKNLYNEFTELMNTQNKRLDKYNKTYNENLKNDFVQSND